MSTPRIAIDSDRLDGWKSIAHYLRRDRTTAMRWAATRGLPVHQVPGGKRASVYAIGHELDRWLAGTDALPATETTRISRRVLVAGGLATAVAGAAGLSTLDFARSGISSEASALIEQARFLRSQNTRETQNQAIGLALEAVRLAPRYADAWGLLGYARAVASRWRREAEAGELRDQAVMDGQRALDLDPSNAKGELALAAALPLLGTGNWLARANGLKRALANDPHDPDVLLEQAWILRFTGHCVQAAETCERIDPRHYSPPVYNIWIRALWSAGRIAEMDRKLVTAASLYPSNNMLWFTRLETLLFSGRADEVARIARDERGRPSIVTRDQVEWIAALAESIRRDDPARAAASLRVQQGKAREGVRQAANAIRFAAVTGQLDAAFALADAYFFGRGFAVDESFGNGLFEPLSQRHTNLLFEPPVAAMRADPRFAWLTKELGLEWYWREARNPPDYRRYGSPLKG